MSSLLPGAGPVDPAYTRFKDGLEGVAANTGDLRRWHGLEQAWKPYDTKDWLFAELPGIAATSPDDAMRQKEGTWPNVVWEVVEGFDNIPKLFAALNAASAAIKSRHPGVKHPVWTPWQDGQWRQAVEVDDLADVELPPGLPKEALDRIQTVRESVMPKGPLTPAEGRRRIYEIVAEYT